MAGFVRAVDRLSFLCAIVAAALLTAAAFLITWLVIWRSMGNSAYWELELSIYMMVMATFLGSPYCLRTKGHVAVDLLTAYLPERWSRRFNVFVIALGFAICVFLAYEGWELTHDAYLKGEGTGSIWNPRKWPLYSAMPIGMALTALQYVAELFRREPMGAAT